MSQRMQFENIHNSFSQEQYKFLYEAILEEHTSSGTRMTFDQFDLAFPDDINIHKPRTANEFKASKHV